jgi:orotidine 5''-phosphate decarboxylase, subfamily 1
VAVVTAIPIVALDFPDAERAMTLVQTLDEKCRFYKVGSELFTASGADIVQWLRDTGCEVFLDLKFHDIPNTVAGAVRNVAKMGVKLTTVHASGGSRMMEAAVEAAGESCGVLAVTILTSLDDATLGEAWGRDRVDVENEVLRLAELARSAGVHGIVCSGQEARAVSSRHGSALKLLFPASGYRVIRRATRQGLSLRPTLSKRGPRISCWAGPSPQRRIQGRQWRQ